MALDFGEYFKRYEALAAEADALFSAIQAKHPQEVACEKGCSDCCHALFDVTLVEALYLNHQFNRLHKGESRSRVLERSDAADRQIHKLKHRLHKASQEGRNVSDILREVALAKVRCPLLGDEDLCLLYEHRPITCRLYGVPTDIGGEAHTCNRSRFSPGKSYPTVHIGRIQDRLFALSAELTVSLDTKYPNMGDMLIPPSMALLADFDEEYLGIRKEKPEAPAAARQAKGEACVACKKDESACGDCETFSVTLGRPATDGSGED